MVIQAGNTLFYMGKRYTIPAGMPIANWTPEAVKKYIIPNQTPTLPILPKSSINQGGPYSKEIREENGVLNIFGGAVFTGIGAIALYTVLGVACPPALLIAGVAASSGAIVYGSSMFMEGVDEISLAQQGDTVTKAFNPIRDTIFDGDQGDYDLFGAISTAGSIVSAQAAAGYAGGTTDTSQHADNAEDAAKHADLFDELASSGVKYNPEDVVSVFKRPDGTLMWLEKGNDTSGLTHIINRHADDFAAKGIDDIPSLLEKVLSTDPIRTGNGLKGPFADFSFAGSVYKVVYGTNGYIVTFYPID